MSKVTETPTMEKSKPSLHLDSVDLPDLEKMSLNDKVSLRISGTVTSLSQDYEDKKKSNATIEISKIKKVGGSITDEEYEDMSEKEQDGHFDKEEKRITEK